MANDRNWSAVDDYLAETTVAQDHALEAALADTEAAGLPSIEVSPTHGKMLHLLARIAGARNALEIGALGGYSTIWIARALPAGGKLVTLEANERHASVARANITRAGLADRVEIRVGAALDSLPKIEAEGLAPFDFVFIDADKENNANYVAWALRLSRPGTTVRRRQRGQGRPDSGREVPGSRRRRRAKNVRDDEERAATSRDRRSDRRRQGLGRLCARGRSVIADERQTERPPRGGLSNEELRAQAAIGTDLRDDRYPTKPSPAKPNVIIAQVEGSGAEMEKFSEPFA